MAEEILKNELENEEEIVLENEAAEDDLQAKVDALIKEKDGLYKEMIAERRTRQELKSQNQALQEQFETVKQVLSEIKESKTSGKQKGSGIKLKYDDDGDPYKIGRHTSELQSHSFISYAVFCLKKKKKI